MNAPPSVEIAVRTAVGVIRQSPDSSDERVLEELMRRGIEERIAFRLVLFVPSAYCRVLLRQSGVRFSEMYHQRGSDKEWPLANEPIWTEAIRSAESESKTIPKDDYLRVAARSAEFNVINQMLYKGSKLKDLTLTPILVRWSDDLPQTPLSE